MKEFKGFIIGIIFTLILSGTIVAASSSVREIVFGVSVNLEGIPIVFPEDSQPFIMDGRTFLPVRTVADLVGLHVSFADGVVMLSADAPPARPVVDPRVISEAFDAYVDVMNSISTGFDADMKTVMAMNRSVGAGSMGTDTSTTTGNVQTFIDGEFSQGAAVRRMVTTMELGSVAQTVETDTEWFVERDGDDLSFFLVKIDGVEYDTPASVTMLNNVPNVVIPRFAADAIITAAIAKTENETQVTMILDERKIPEFVSGVLNELLADVEIDMANMSLSMDGVAFTLVFDGDGNLLRVKTEMEMLIGMDMGIGFDFTILATVTSEYVYNRVGGVEITMPSS
jgi:hypothetical protein